MTRREWMLAGLAVPAAFAMKSRLSKASVSAVTDEIGKTQADAIDFARSLEMKWVELRTVPESKKPFTSLSVPEMKRYAAELGANNLKVAMLHAPGAADFDKAVAAAGILGADRIRISETPDEVRLVNGMSGVDWDPRRGTAPPRGRLLHVRVPADTLEGPAKLPWKSILETLQKENYLGHLALETGSTGAASPERTLESMKTLLHLTGLL